MKKYKAPQAWVADQFTSPFMLLAKVMLAGRTRPGSRMADGPLRFLSLEANAANPAPGLMVISMIGECRTLEWMYAIFI